MVITRTPLRISLAGGGSDLPAFCDEEPGCVLNFTIDKYVYVCVKNHFTRGRIRVAYSSIEDVPSFFSLNHDMVRQALHEGDIDRGVDITSIADIPSGVGLGSSSSFAVGLTHALFVHNNERTYLAKLAKDAFNLERRSGRSIGYQDIYAAVVGGLVCYTFHKGEANWRHVMLTDRAMVELQNNLILLWTGRTHDASSLIKKQSARLLEKDSRERANLRAMANIAETLTMKLKGGDDLSIVADALGASWALKKGFEGVCDSQIDKWYSAAQEAAASGPFGGKLLGAGGGGCLLFYALQSRHQDIVRATGLRQIPFRFTNKGTDLLMSNPD